MGRVITRPGYIILTEGQVKRLAKGHTVVMNRAGVETHVQVSRSAAKKRELRAKIAEYRRKLNMISRQESRVRGVSVPEEQA